MMKFESLFYIVFCIASLVFYALTKDYEPKIKVTDESTSAEVNFKKKASND